MRSELRTDASESNKLIEGYYKKALQRKMVDFDQLSILCDGLSKTYYESERLSAVRTQDRMLETFLKEKVKDLTIPQVIEMSKARYTVELRNKTIETYFEEKLQTLSWEETKVLMGSLGSNEYGRYTNQAVTQRMTLSWNSVHN